MRVARGGRFAWLLVALGALAVVGCAGERATRPGAAHPETVTQKINLSGYPPEFRQGFSAGCGAARAHAPATRPKGEASYVAGWSDGYDYCSPKPKK
jgi:hypothetical protein